MVQEKINEMIKESMLAHDKIRTETYRSMKTAFLNWQTDKKNIGKDMTDADEVIVLNKLSIQYEETARDCNDGKHDELVADATASAAIVKEFLPAPVTEEKIDEVCLKVIEENQIEPIKKNMSNIMRLIKAELPSADGKVASQIIMRHLH